MYIISDDNNSRIFFIRRDSEMIHASWIESENSIRLFSFIHV